MNPSLNSSPKRSPVGRSAFSIRIDSAMSVSFCVCSVVSFPPQASPRVKARTGRRSPRLSVSLLALSISNSNRFFSAAAFARWGKKESRRGSLSSERGPVMASENGTDSTLTVLAGTVERRRRDGQVSHSATSFPLQRAGVRRTWACDALGRDDALVDEGRETARERL